MSNLKCKYCGKDFYAGRHCTHSPNKKHKALTDGVNCICCGKLFHAGRHCTHSPTKKHLLDN
jgi:hypothetical protein